MGSDERDAQLVDAITGAALLIDERPTKANLARVIGVHRSQITRWMQGATPTRRYQVLMNRLIWLARSREQVRRDIAHLKEEGFLPLGAIPPEGTCKHGVPPNKQSCEDCMALAEINHGVTRTPKLIVIGTPHPNEYREPRISTARAASDDEPLGAVKLMEQDASLEGKCGTCRHYMPESKRCACAFDKGDCFETDSCDDYEMKKGELLTQ